MKYKDKIGNPFREVIQAFTKNSDAYTSSANVNLSGGLALMFTFLKVVEMVIWHVFCCWAILLWSIKGLELIAKQGDVGGGIAMFIMAVIVIAVYTDLIKQLPDFIRKIIGEKHDE